MNNPKILVIAGPTATGKSERAVEIAERLDTEILSADSMQVYRGMDIGTAKPSPALRARVPHHLLDVADPTEHFDVVRYRELTEPVLERLLKEGRTPVIAGGTGFYIRGLLDGIFSAPRAPVELRKSLEQEAGEQGNEALHARLAAVDPESAGRLHPNDVRRVVRALEVYESTGRPLSAWHREHRKAAWGEQAVYVCLKMELPLLDRRIETRVDVMLAQGLVDEVAGLLKRGCNRGHTSMQALGYKEVAAHLEGEYSLDEARAKVILETRQFSRKQIIWFRGDKRYRMVDAADENLPDKLIQLLHNP